MQKRKNIAAWENNKTAGFDHGLQKYMSNVFMHMFLGLMLTACVSFLISSSITLKKVFFFSEYMMIVYFIGQIGLSFYLGSKIKKLSMVAATSLFYGLTFLMGITLSIIVSLFDAPLLMTAFFIASSVFLGMSIYGYVTKKDLTGLGSFLIMGLWGLIISQFILFFTGGSVAHMVVSAVGVLIFTGMIAYDVQQIKGIYYDILDEEIRGKVSIIGALQLYLDFINLFLYILRLLASLSRRD